MIGPEALRALAEGRWTVPVLALLFEERGARFARLTGRLGAPRDSVVRTLDHLFRQGWIDRNPGHGHPLRPEYLLTSSGAAVAAACAGMMAVRRRLGLTAEALPRWSLPILDRLNAEPHRFSSLQAELTPVTARALSLNLKAMMRGQVVSREVFDAYPPMTLYGLGPGGRALAESLRS